MFYMWKNTKCKIDGSEVDNVVQTDKVLELRTVPTANEYRTDKVVQADKAVKLSNLQTTKHKPKNKTDKTTSRKNASVQQAVWRNGGSNPAEKAVRN